MTSKQLLEFNPAEIAKLPSKDIPSLVNAAIALDRDIKLATETLSHFKARFVEEAEIEARKAEMKTIGTTWNFKSELGETCQVVFPEDSLIKGGFFFVKGQACRIKDKVLVKLGDIKGIAGAAFDKLFAPSYKPAKAFRELSQALLTEAKAKELLALCSEQSSPRVSFKTADSQAS